MCCFGITAIFCVQRIVSFFKQLSVSGCLRPCTGWAREARGEPRIWKWRARSRRLRAGWVVGDHAERRRFGGPPPGDAQSPTRGPAGRSRGKRPLQRGFGAPATQAGVWLRPGLSASFQRGVHCVLAAFCRGPVPMSDLASRSWPAARRQRTRLTANQLGDSWNATSNDPRAGVTHLLRLDSGHGR